MTFDYENLKLFYIGKEKITGQNFAPLVYKNKDLTTHAAIIGMTGSGKTYLLYLNLRSINPLIYFV